MHQWTELDATPTLPASLPHVPDGTGTWWRAAVGPKTTGAGAQRVRHHALVGPDSDGAQHGHETYVHVAGDGKASAIYVLTIYTLPLAPPSASAQFPTIPELWHIMSEFALPGALFAILGPHGPSAMGVAAGTPPDHPDGHVIQIVQTGCEEGSPAAHRFKLSDVVSPAGIISIAGRAQA